MLKNVIKTRSTYTEKCRFMGKELRFCSRRLSELSWSQSSPVLSPPSLAEGLNPQSSIFSVFQSSSVSVLFSPSQSFSVLKHIYELLQVVSGIKLITNVLIMFLAIPVTLYTVNLHLGNYSFYQRQIFTFIFEICSLVCSSSTC